MGLSPRYTFTVALVAILLAFSVLPVQARVYPPKLYPFSASQGAVRLSCVQVNGLGPFLCNGAYVAPLTDATVIRSFAGGATVTYYHQSVACQPTTSTYGRWACSWSLTQLASRRAF